MGDFIKQWWVGCVFGAAVGAFGAFYAKHRALRAGVRALLRNQIIESYNKCEKEECCPIYRLESIEDMYAQYHALGGNGAVTELMTRIREMPTKHKIKEVS